MSKLYEAQLALERAEDTLDESAHNLDGGFTIATVNRAYYAIFYCLTALLYTEDIQTKRQRSTGYKFHSSFASRVIMIWKQTFRWMKLRRHLITPDSFTN